MSDDDENGSTLGAAGMTAKLTARLKKFEERLLKLASNPVSLLILCFSFRTFKMF